LKKRKRILRTPPHLQEDVKKEMFIATKETSVTIVFAKNNRKDSKDTKDPDTILDTNTEEKKTTEH
jgi:hypothetical protein